MKTGQYLTFKLYYIKLHEPLTSIAAGQAAAFYRDDVVLGSGRHLLDNGIPVNSGTKTAIPS